LFLIRDPVYAKSGQTHAHRISLVELKQRHVSYSILYQLDAIEIWRNYAQGQLKLSHWKVFIKRQNLDIIRVPKDAVDGRNVETQSGARSNS
jgi:hypothetical protein